MMSVSTGSNLYAGGLDALKPTKPHASITCRASLDFLATPHLAEHEEAVVLRSLLLEQVRVRKQIVLSGRGGVLCRTPPAAAPDRLRWLGMDYGRRGDH